MGTDIHMYGSTPAGETVFARVTGFKPYLFMRAGKASDERINTFIKQLNRALILLTVHEANGSIGKGLRLAVERGKLKELIVAHETVEGVALKPSGANRGFNDATTERVVKVYFYAPAYVRVTRDLLEHVYDNRDRRFATQADALCLLVETHVSRAFTRTEASASSSSTTTQPAAKRLKPTEQRLIAAAQRTPSLTDAMPRPTLDDGEEDANPWADNAVDIAFNADDDDDDDDGDAMPRARDSPDTNKSVALKALAEFNAGVETMQRSLRLDDEEAVEIYEADIDFVLRYLIDAGFKAEECIEVVDDATPGSLARRSDGASLVNDIELVVDWRELRRCADERFQKTVPPQVCLSLDCEMELGADNAFPKAESERVLQICCIVFDPVADPKVGTIVRRAFVIDSIALPSEEQQRSRQRFVFGAAEVYAFAAEAEMLHAFSSFVRALQPDMITGYNVEGFDLTYLLERAKALKLELVPMCRSPAGAMRSFDRQFSSSAHGTHLYKEVTGDGLFVYDVFQALKRSTVIKLRSYSLEYVSTTFLGDRKDDVAYSKINAMQMTPEGRYALMHYCTKDAVLPARLLGKLALHLNNIVMARLTGVTVDMVARRGLQVRLKSYLYRVASAQPMRHLFYTRTNADRRAVEGTSYEGAHVEQPVTGLHDEPVVTLDFNSLYPSIMSTFNMCYTTLIPGRQLAERCARYGLDPETDVWTNIRDALPGDDEDQPTFVRSTRLQGLIPLVLAEVIEARKRVRALIPGEPDAFKRTLLDMEQLTLKTLANSLYGFTGAETSTGSCPEIAAAVTAIGRSVIRETKAIVEAEYSIERGKPFDAQVVYGDTDSVFVRLHVKASSKRKRIEVDDSAAHGGVHTNDSVFWGKHMADFVTAHFRKKFGDRDDNVMRIVFEKTFYPWLSYGKKRYVGWKYELKTDATTGVESLRRSAEPIASGMETERRDSCPFIADAVRHVVRLLLTQNVTRAQTLERVRTYIANDVIGRLEAGTVPWHELVQSKQFRKRVEEYTSKGQTPPIHILLVAKLERRREDTGVGVVYQSGDRVQFVVTEGAFAGQRTSECAEDPDYAWTHGLRLSRDHYIHNVVGKTMARILDPVLKSREASATLASAFGVAAAAATADDASLHDARKAETRYKTFMSSALASRQASAHARPRTGLAALATSVVRRCRLCGVPSATDVCASHDAATIAAVDSADAAIADELAVERQQLARECGACKQGFRAKDEPERAAALPALDTDDVDIEEALPCQTNSCDIYWRRRLVDRQFTQQLRR